MCNHEFVGFTIVTLSFVNVDLCERKDTIFY
jgi:hypothetical protein